MRGKRNRTGRLWLTAAAGTFTLALMAGNALWSQAADGRAAGMDGQEKKEEAEQAAGAPAASAAEAAGVPAAGSGADAAGSGPPAGAAVLAAATGSEALAGSADPARLHGARLASGRLFSLRDQLGEAPGEAWNVPASLLFEAALKAGLGIVERHVGLGLAKGAAPGFEARVDGPRRDLRLYNGLAFDVWVDARQDEAGRLEIRLVGDPPDGWTAPALHVETERLAPPVMVLSDGGGTDYRPSWTARDGRIAYVYRLVDGERVLLHKDFYPPLPDVDLRRGD